PASANRWVTCGPIVQRRHLDVSGLVVPLDLEDASVDERLAGLGNRYGESSVQVPDALPQGSAPTEHLDLSDRLLDGYAQRGVTIRFDRQAELVGTGRSRGGRDHEEDLPVLLEPRAVGNDVTPHIVRRGCAGDVRRNEERGALLHATPIDRRTVQGSA